MENLFKFIISLSRSIQCRPFHPRGNAGVQDLQMYNPTRGTKADLLQTGAV